MLRSETWVVNEGDLSGRPLQASLRQGQPSRSTKPTSTENDTQARAHGCPSFTLLNSGHGISYAVTSAGKDYWADGNLPAIIERTPKF